MQDVALKPNRPLPPEDEDDIRVARERLAAIQRGDTVPASLEEVLDEKDFELDGSGRPVRKKGTGAASRRGKD